MSNLRLYQLVDTKSNRVVPDFYFPNKMEAKKERRNLNEFDSEGNEILRYVVSYGPDHARRK